MKGKLLIASLLTTSMIWSGCQKTAISTNDALSTDHNFGNSEKSGTVIKGKYIVRFNNSSVEIPAMKAENNYTARTEMMRSVMSKIHQEITGKAPTFDFVYSNAIIGYAGSFSPQEIELLKRDPRVASIEEDQIVALAKPGSGGGGTSPSQTIPWGVSRVNGGTTTSSHKAWILDSGIDLDHPDLNVNTALSVSFLGGTSTPDDENGHGTHVAGTVAAKNNSIGVVGVAPGSSVVSVRVLNRRGTGSISGIIAGVDYVKNNAAANDVANMSLGGGVSTSLDAAVLSASGTCKFVLAAGNESDNANNHSPARVNGPNVYTVSAMTISNTWASFSNYGSAVDYIEPGVNIPSTWKGGGYNTISGTSMAAPHLTGILLLGNVSVGGYVNVTPNLPDTDPIGVH